MRFRSKPKEIEAEQFTREHIEAYLFDKQPLPAGVRCTSAHYHMGNRTISNYRCRVTTIHGQSAQIAEGDWIITESDGIHHYPCKPDIFADTYERIEECPLCAKPLDGEQHFHKACADEEQAWADRTATAKV